MIRSCRQQRRQNAYLRRLHTNSNSNKAPSVLRPSLSAKRQYLLSLAKNVSNTSSKSDGYESLYNLVPELFTDDLGNVFTQKDSFSIEFYHHVKLFFVLLLFDGINQIQRKYSTNSIFAVLVNAVFQLIFPHPCAVITFYLGMQQVAQIFVE